jgi:ABC-type uncharacterized transport system permease subunit
VRGSHPDPAELARIADVASQPAIALVDSEASLRQLAWTTYFSAGMAILFLFFAAQSGMLSLFEERRDGTLARILAGPIRPATVLAGKALGSFVTASVAMTILVVATTLLIGADWGLPVGVALLVVAAIISAIGITTLVTSFFRTLDGAASASSAVAITLGILGGTFAPVSEGPEAMATISLLTPHAWFLRGLAELHGPTATIADALPAVGVLLAMGLVTGAIGFAARAPGSASMTARPARPVRPRVGHEPAGSARPGRASPGSTWCARCGTGQPVLRVRAANDHHRGARAPFGGSDRAPRSWFPSTTRRQPRWSPSSRRIGRLRRAGVRERGRPAAAVERGNVEAGVVVPAGYGARRARRRRDPVPRHPETVTSAIGPSGRGGRAGDAGGGRAGGRGRGQGATTTAGGALRRRPNVTGSRSVTRDQRGSMFGATRSSRSAPRPSCCCSCS